MHMKKSKTLLSLLFAGMMWMPLTAGAVTTNGHATSVAPDDQTISGTVEDANGPMIGATVKVVGSSAGTVPATRSCGYRGDSLAHRGEAHLDVEAAALPTQYAFSSLR